MTVANNFGYAYISKNDIFLNKNLFLKIYSPILGEKSSSLYLFMIEESLNQKFSLVFKNTIENFLSYLKISLDEFNIYRKQLEALNLLKTFIDETKKIIYFEIFEPLDVDSFFLEDKYVSLLSKKIGANNLPSLKFSLSIDGYKKDNFSDISSSFEEMFENEQNKKFNFNLLNNLLLDVTSLKINLSSECLDIISNYFDEYKCEYSLVLNCIINAVESFCENELIISPGLLELNFISAFSKKNDDEIFYELNRDKNIFLKKLFKDDLVLFFEDYTKISNENYLASITKSSLNEEEFKILSLLKSKYKIKSEILNMMIDYSLLKTNGKLNEKYLVKMACSFNALNITNLDEAYNYLVNKDVINKVKTNKPINLDDSKFIISQSNIKYENKLLEEKLTEEIFDDEIVDMKW